MRYTDTTIWTRLADKYAVRDFVKSRGLENILIPLLGKWDDANDINYDQLPDMFVLKCNHDSGSVYVINKDKGYDKNIINENLNKHLHYKFRSKFEEHYSYIQPCIIAEEYLEQTDINFTNSLVDYKIWCFDGKPYSIWACYNRTHECTYVNVYDLEWNCHPEHSVFTHHYRDGKGKLPKPKSLKEMLNVASVLSKGFPQVRVDLYNIDGKIYFGEMTFTSASAIMDFYTPDYLVELGNQVVLPQPTK